jgi:hypothetical protein
VGEAFRWCWREFVTRRRKKGPPFLDPSLFATEAPALFEPELETLAEARA